MPSDGNGNYPDPAWPHTRGLFSGGRRDRDSLEFESGSNDPMAQPFQGNFSKTRGKNYTFRLEPGIVAAMAKGFELPELSSSERTPLVEGLLAIIESLAQEVQCREELIGQLRDEIAVLKGE